MLQSDFIADLIALATAAADRVHHLQVPQGVAMPFIATSQVSGNQPITLDGSKLLQRAGIRVAIFADKGLDTLGISSALRARYNGFKGVIGSTTIHHARVETAADEASFVDGDKIIKGAMLDVFFLYTE